MENILVRIHQNLTYHLDREALPSCINEIQISWQRDSLRIQFTVLFRVSV